MDNTDLQEVGWGGMNCIIQAQDRDRWRALIKAIPNLGVQLSAGNLLTRRGPVTLLGRTLLSAVRWRC